MPGELDQAAAAELRAAEAMLPAVSRRVYGEALAVARGMQFERDEALAAGLRPPAEAAARDDQAKAVAAFVVRELGLPAPPPLTPALQTPRPSHGTRRRTYWLSYDRN